MVGAGKRRHGKQRVKCRECRGEGEAAGGEGRGREEPQTQRREKRARRSPFICSSLGCAGRWRRPLIPLTEPCASGARRCCRPRSPRTHACVGHAGISFAAASWGASI